MTDMYNVLAKVRAGEELGPADQQIYAAGQLTILRQLHDELDAAVAAAYGWPPDLAEEEILLRLVELNRQRAAEEAQGWVRWLRPEYQAPRAGLAPVQETLVEDAGDAGAAAGAPTLPAARAWPETMAAQAAAVRAVLQAAGGPLTAAQVAAAFAGGDKAQLRRVEELLATLAALGQAHVEGTMFAGI